MENQFAVLCSDGILNFVFYLFEDKMVLKHLRSLTASELRIELKRAGIKGKYVKAEAIMRLTTHLIDVSEDPMTFEFDPDMPIDEIEADNDPNDYVVTNDDLEVVHTSVGDTAASVSGLITSIGAGSSSTFLPVTTSSIPFVSTSTASITTSTTTTSTASTSIPSPFSNQFPPNAGVRMHNPFNPVLYPGMPGGDYFAQYPGMSAGPWSQGLAGMSPTGPAPPWAGMWTPSGGWTPHLVQQH